MKELVSCKGSNDRCCVTGSVLFEIWMLGQNDNKTSGLSNEKLENEASKQRLQFIALCKVQILAPPPDFERKLNGKNTG